jgi:hypothetical protein
MAGSYLHKPPHACPAMQCRACAIQHVQCLKNPFQDVARPPSILAMPQLLSILPREALMPKGWSATSKVNQINSWLHMTARVLGCSLSQLSWC